MSVSVLRKEFERLAERNAKLLHTDDGEGRSMEESKKLSDEFEGNLGRLGELKSLLEKEKEFGVLQDWASSPERRVATQNPEATDGPPAKARKSAGRQVVDNPEFKSWLEQIAPGGQISDGTPIKSQPFEVKDLVGSAATSGGAFFERDYTGLYVPYIQPTLTVRDLVINATTDKEIVEYVRANVHVNAAANVAEAANANDGAISGASPGPYTVAAASGQKPEGAFTWTKVTRSVDAIAEGVPIAKRALLNGGQMASIIDDQLRYDVSQRLNSQMLEGNGAAPNFTGIRNEPGILTQAFSGNIIETLRKAKTKVSSPTTGSGKIPTGVAMTPENHETLDLFRVGGSVATDGPYQINPYGDQPMRLWGMTLVEEPGLTANKAVVGYFRDAVLWDNQQTTVQAFDQHKDFASRNLVYLLAEWWGTFGVLQPRSFCDSTLA